MRFKKNNKPWNKGLKGFLSGTRHYLFGKHIPLETRMKMSKSRIGKEPANKGKSTKPFCGECGTRLAKSSTKFCQKCYRGKHHSNWLGGISKDVHSPKEPKYRKWRSDVFQRDNWTCQTCGVRGVYLEAHHIKSWAKYPELRYVVDNGVVLCKECHQLTDNYRGKKYG